MPKLKVLVGPTPNELTPITPLVNTNTPHRIVTDAWEVSLFSTGKDSVYETFQGEILVFIKGFNEADPSKTTPEAVEYFGREDRSGVTWSIQVQGPACILSAIVLAVNHLVCFRPVPLSSLFRRHSIRQYF
jgi:hypothetical protein